VSAAAPRIGDSKVLESRETDDGTTIRYSTVRAASGMLDCAPTAIDSRRMSELSCRS